MKIKWSENKGIALLEKGKRGVFHLLFSRIGLVVVLLLVQIAFFIFVILKSDTFSPHIMGGTTIISAFVVLYLLNTQIDPSAKLTWLIIITLLPVFGALLFLYTQSELGHRTLAKRYDDIIKSTKNYISGPDEVMKNLKTENESVAGLATYINRCGCYPAFTDTEVKYFPTGEDKFKNLLIELEKAEKFIFLEYFIIDEGKMWGKVLEILAKKAKQGVDVRLLYDGTCEFFLLPHNYPKKLQELGIKCKMFAPITPFLSTHYNYRDHRKIVVIDGHTAFNGGINLADEYINEKEKYGYWKDTAVMVKGEVVKNFTLMFLQMWAIDEKKPDYRKYLDVDVPKTKEGNGYVIAYGDCPLDDDKVGEKVYMDILNRATKYVHIMSPYLILDSEMEMAIKFAAERGVEVVLILPGIPDKKIPYALAKTHYKSLLASGVKIREFTPGFVHAKVFVSDDNEAVVGTINLDYRSFYHHFECATYMYKVDAISDIEADFQNTLLKCKKVNLNTIKKENVLTKICGYLAKIVAPLM